MPHSVINREESKGESIEQKLNPTPQPPDDQTEDIMDSKFLSSYSSVNEISDIDEHSGLKKLEKHLGSSDILAHPTFDEEEEKIQLVTEVSQYHDEEILESSSRPIQATNTSIRSKMMDEYNHK